MIAIDTGKIVTFENASNVIAFQDLQYKDVCVELDSVIPLNDSKA